MVEMGEELKWKEWGTDSVKVWMNDNSNTKNGNKINQNIFICRILLEYS